MQYSVKTEIENLLVQQPLLSADWANDDVILSGNYKIHYQFGEEIYSDYFGLEIRINNNFPAEIPVVKGTDGRIRPKTTVRESNYKGHIYPDGRFCLELDTVIKIALDQNPSVLFFLTEYLGPYLFGFLYFQKHGIMPFGERAHGVDGAMGYYCELFDVEDTQSAEKLLYILVNSSFKGHRDCPCGSLKRYRHCHRQQITDLRQSKYYELYKSDYLANEEIKPI